MTTAIQIKGIVTGPEDAFALLPKAAMTVKSWDNDTAPKAQALCRSALKDAGFYCESVFSGKCGSKNRYGLYIYRDAAERGLCFAAHADPLAGMYHYR